MRLVDKIQLSDNAMTVLERRYLRKDENGNIIETPREMFLRVAKFIAEADRGYGGDDARVEETTAKFFNMMARLEFVPNSPTLMNAGRPLGQLSACFVLPVGDSMEEIFETNKHAAIIHKSGGGTGFSFSRLRPKNSIVASTSGVASGPVSFMKVYDASTEAVKQGGTRRGANMGILRVDHPDILEFISSKDKTDEVTNFNISVAVTDEFMTALADGTTYPLIDPRSGRVHEIDGKQVHLKAADVWRDIVEHAWATGEPGVVFIDRMDRLNPTSPVERIEATNPCGEQPLPPYDSCNLGSINVSRFVQDGDGDTDSQVNWGRLREAVQSAVHFLDNVIDQNRYPLPMIEAQTKKNRRIGLGVMGFADMLVRLGLRYDSELAQQFGERLMAFIDQEAKDYSSELVRTRGKFPNWEGSIYKRQDVTMRNATVTTVAPTGTISIIAGCSSGIEPYYSLAFERNVLDGTRMLEVNPLFEQVAKERGFYSDELMHDVAGLRSIAQVEEIPEEVRELFVTAADVSPRDHILMQAAFQKHVDSSVSKTINFAESASVEDVREAFELAYETGCKGVTIYRDNSRPDQVLSIRSTEATLKSEPTPEQTHAPAERPQILQGITEKIRTGYGNLYVTINVRDGQPFEVFAHIGKSGYSTMADTEAICRLISLSLRSGVPIELIIKQLRGIGGSAQVYSGGSRVTSIPDAIAQVLGKHFGTPSGGTPQGPVSGSAADICPECASPMTFDAGCHFCQTCGYSTC